jgi:hypothetical protein
VFGPELVARSDREKLRVEPDVLVILGQKKAPTGRETEIRKYGRQQAGNMRYVMRLKEVWICRERLASPDVPAASVALGRMAEAVQGPFARPCVPSDPYLGVWRGFHELGGIPPTNPSLGQVIAVRHFRVGLNAFKLSGEHSGAERVR